MADNKNLNEQLVLLQKQIGDLTKVKERLLRVEDDIFERMRLQTETEKEKVKISTEELRIYQEYLDIVQVIKSKQAELNLTKVQGNETLEEQTALLREIEVLQESISGFAVRAGESEQDRIERIKSYIKETEKLNELKSKTLQLETDIDNALENNLALTLGISRAWEGTMGGVLLRAKELGDFSGALKRMSTEFSQSVIANAGPSMMLRMQEKTIELAGSMEDARASFVRATGAGNDHVNSILQNSRQFAFLGIGVREAGAATTALYQDMISFNRASKEQQLLLVKNVALLERFGVSMSTAAKIAGELDALYKMDAQSVEKLNRELFAISGQGLATNQIFENFAATLPQLAKHGKDSIAVFKGLSAQTRTLQIDTQELLGIVEGFDMYDKASDSVSVLNAALGGDYFNSLQMVNASEEERVELLLEGMAASGKNWEAMNKHERMLVANSVGITDMATAQKLFNKDLATYRKELAEVKASSMTPEELEKRAKLTQTLEDNLKRMSETFAVSFYPIVEMLNKVIQLYGELDSWVQKTTGGIIGLGSVVTVMFLAFRMGKFAINAVTLATQLNAAASGEAAVANGVLGKSVSTTTTAFKANAKQLMAIGAMVAMIGAGIGFAAYGFSKLGESLEKLNSEQLTTMAMTTGIIVGGMLLMSVALVALAASSAAAAGPILAVGGAVLLMGSGLAVAAYGVSILSESLKDIDAAVISEMGSLVGSVAAAMLVLSTIAPILPVVALGYGAMAVSLLAVAAAMSMLDVDKLAKMNSSIEGVNSSMVKLFDSMSNMEAATVEQVIKPVMKSVQETIKVANDSKDATEVFKELNNVTQKVDVKNNSSGSTIKSEVHVYLDGKELETYVTKVVNKELDIRR